MEKLTVYNSLTRKKEVFEPLNPPFVGMYVCGPTVYGDAHLGHAKSYISFDVIYRYLLFLNYKVRYVQNITDVGHLTDDADQGDDKILKQASAQRIEPMEVVEYYMYTYYRDMDALNVLRPSIAPRPSGHIPEQIEAIKHLIGKGFAYEVNGSVYFDVLAYNKGHDYGKLSGRKVEELMEGSASRELDKQSEKRNLLDFALWKKADDFHIMRWDSPWGKGYPGWHLECSVMSQKYLGDTFDIHGGGMENMFPHHECEIAQAEAEKEKPFARYWLHNNMVTINGQKMGKSLGNSVFVHELFNGENKLLEKAYSPMTVRFFILQSHYRSTIDFSNEALQAAEKGYKRLMAGYKAILELEEEKFTIEASSVDEEIKKLCSDCKAFMNDDFNTARLIASLFDLTNRVNVIRDKKQRMSREVIKLLKDTFSGYIEEVLGLKEESGGQDEVVSGLMELVLEIRRKAREDKDWAVSDKIRDQLLSLGIDVKDSKEGSSWSIH